MTMSGAIIQIFWHRSLNWTEIFFDANQKILYTYESIVLEDMFLRGEKSHEGRCFVFFCQQVLSERSTSDSGRMMERIFHFLFWKIVVILQCKHFSLYISLLSFLNNDIVSVYKTSVGEIKGSYSVKQETELATVLCQVGRSSRPVSIGLHFLVVVAVFVTF